MRPREVRIEGNIAFVPLTKGYVAIIDAADAPIVGQFNWTADVSQHTVYAHRKDTANGYRKVYLHRFLMGDCDGLEVDHQDCDGLNNRRANLRFANRSQNTANRRREARNTSGFKGVSWHSATGKWRARIRLNGKTRSLGLHETKEAAFAAYEAAIVVGFGEFGRAA